MATDQFWLYAGFSVAPQRYVHFCILLKHFDEDEDEDGSYRFHGQIVGIPHQIQNLRFQLGRGGTKVKTIYNSDIIADIRRKVRIFHYQTNIWAFDY